MTPGVVQACAWCGAVVDAGSVRDGTGRALDGAATEHDPGGICAPCLQREVAALKAMRAAQPEMLSGIYERRRRWSPIMRRKRAVA